MALTDNLTTEKAALIALLESEYTEQNLRDQLLKRLYYVRFLLGDLGGGGGAVDAAIGTNSDTLPLSSILVGGKHNGEIIPMAVDNSGHLILNATDVQTSADSISTTVSQVSFTETQLTAVGTTTSRSMVGYNQALITATVANINTNVVVRVEISNDGTNWTNASVLNTDTTITTNKTEAFVFSGCPANIRFNFVSESGGTAATINVIVRLSA